MSHFSKPLMVLVLVGSVLQAAPAEADTTREAVTRLGDGVRPS